MASAGFPRLVIGKVLNHAEPGVTAVYDRHTYDAEKREALQTWARSLRALLDADSAGRGPRLGEPAGRQRVEAAAAHAEVAPLNLPPERPLVDPMGPPQGRVRAIRGGSYLCHDSYCNRYRVAARHANEPTSTTGNMGFRLAADAEAEIGPGVGSKVR